MYLLFNQNDGKKIWIEYLKNTATNTLRHKRIIATIHSAFATCSIKKKIKMSVLLILLIISIIIATGFLVAFLWSVNTNQFDDVEMPQHKILFDNNLNNKKI